MEAFLSFTRKGNGKGDAERIPASDLKWIYQSEKGLGMRVARPTDETQVLVRTVRFGVRFRLRHGQDGHFGFLTAPAPAFYSFWEIYTTG